MDVVVNSIAGTLESGDIRVEISPAEKNGITVELESTVENQFGEQIRKTIAKTLRECGIERAAVHAVDRGALDCTIHARVCAAAYRAAQRNDYTF